jgi:two-component system alkaline phosphatase synthesis response regulator PhoP
MPSVLVVDDEQHIRDLIKFNLEKEGYKVHTAAEGESVVRLAREMMPHLIVLDIMLPGLDGYEVCRILRSIEDTAGIPIIMLSAKGDVVDRVLGLEIGADDYITKPFSPRELLARVKASIRRQKQVTKEIVDKDKEIRCGELLIKPDRFEVLVNGARIDLSPKEFSILALLAANPGRVFSRDALLEQIWGFDAVRETRTVDVHIRYLRQKIEADPGNPMYIETVRGIGYRFRDRQR